MSTSTTEVLLPTHTTPSYKQWVVGRKSPLTHELEEFRGIPFGLIPGRWKHSEIRLSLPSDRYDASRNGPKCPQLYEPNNSKTYQSHVDFPMDVTESEFECLNLIIIRPSHEALKRIGKETEKIPILIWIHGGGFGFGAGTDPMWDPSRLILESLSLGKPFIAVNLNYRLNVFGFAASSELLNDQAGDQRQGCNFGLRDQHVGIQWISGNISYFGGDPSKITLGGQSAGAASVHTHTLSAKRKLESPLFRRSILQSGALGCLGPSPIDVANEDWDTLCNHLGFETGSRISRLERLRTLPAEELVRVQRALGWWAYKVIIDDKTVTSTDSGCDFLINLDDERDLDTNSETANDGPINVLIGDAEEEGIPFAQEMLNNLHFEDVERIIRAAYPSSSAANDVLHAYGVTRNILLTDLREIVVRIVGDVMFGSAISRACEVFSSSPKSCHDNLTASRSTKQCRPTRVHRYKIKFGNPFLGLSQNVSHHCVDLIFLFDVFHDDLVKIDHVESMADQLSPPLSSSSSTASLDLPKELSDGKRSSVTRGSTSIDHQVEVKKAKTNVTLGKEMQKHWIDFITEENLQVGNPGLSNEDSITIYDVDRTIREESLAHNKEWAEQKRRFEVLMRHPEAAKRVSDRLTGQ